MRPVTDVDELDRVSTSSVIDRESIDRVESTLRLPSVFAPVGNLYRTPSMVAMPGMVGFKLWKGASITVDGASASMPGLMGIESGRLTFNQDFGRFSFSAWGNVDKFGYFRGLQTSWGFGGQLSYRFNERLSMTVFGSYSSPLNPHTVAMAPYISAPNFGGYVTYDINDHWGVHVGAQATRSLVTNRWEAQPIVMPYYKINGQAAIGVDVGGILYNVLKDYSSRKNSQYGNPTIGPPVGGPPPVAPHPGR